MVGVDNFWAGLISGLIGAIIGGAFTAWGARMQVKGAFDLAKLQILESRRQQLDEVRLSLRQKATQEFASLIREVNAFYWDLGEQHTHEDWQNGNPCPSPETYPTRLVQLESDLNNCQFIYGAYLPEAAENAIEQAYSLFPGKHHWERLTTADSKYGCMCGIGSWAEDCNVLAGRTMKELLAATQLINR